MRATFLRRLAAAAVSLCFASSHTVSAQPLADRPMDQWPAAFGQILNIQTLVKGGRGETSWSDDGQMLWYATADEVQFIDPFAEAPVAEFDAVKLREVLISEFGDQAARGPLPIGSFRMASDDRLELVWQGQKAEIDLANWTLKRVNGEPAVTPGTFKRNLFLFEAANLPDVLSHSGDFAATVIDGNLALRDREGETIQLTDDAVERYGWDLLSIRMDVRNIRAAPASPWSPDDRRLFAMKLDRRNTPQIQQYKALSLPLPTVTKSDVLFSGGPRYIYEPAIFDVESKTHLTVRGVDFSKHHVLFLDWSDDNKTAYIGRLTRGFSRADVIAVDAETARAEIIYTERDIAALRHSHHIYYAGNFGFTLLPGNEGFLWQSQRDGWNQIYHYDQKGKLKTKVSTDNYPVDFVEAVDMDKRRVYVTARSDQSRPYDVHLVSLSLDGGDAIQLTDGSGIHKVTVSPDKSLFVDHYSSPRIPPKIEIRTIDGDPAHLVDEADISALQATGWKAPIEFKVKSGDGETDIFGVMYLPNSFDPSRRYPVIENVYGGAPILNANFNFHIGRMPGENFPMALAQLGYVVVMFDTEGTVGRSRAFEMAVREKWGPGVVADHAAVIKNLGREYPFVDAESVGIFGHSWGGSNTLMAIATQDDVYDAAVATAPGVSYGGNWDAFMEAYLGAPDDNPEAWQRTVILDYVDQIKKPLLLGVGTQDFFLYAGTLHVSNALIQNGIMHDLMLAPGQGHGIYGPYEQHFMEKTSRFFLKHIPPEGGPAL